MTLRLVPLPSERFPDWREQSIEGYAADLIETGQSAEDAHRHAAQSMVEEFPENAPTPHNAVFDVVDIDDNDAGVRVGYLWVGRDNSDDERSWWVWDIVIEPEFRGTGFGRATMQLAEEYARSQGATTMGLSVFGFNHAAKGLYESLGYEVTTVKMRKSL